MTTPGRGLLAAVTGIRALQLAVWPFAMATAPVTSLAQPLLAGLAWAIAATGTVVTLTRAWLLRRWSASVWWTDALPAAVALLLGGLATQAGHAADFNNAAVAPAIGTALTLGLAVAPGAAVAGGFGLLAAYLLGAWQTVALGPVALTAVAANAVQLAGAPVLVVLLDRALGASRRRAEAAELELAGARARLAAADRQATERTRQYRLLHDTVLSTLSALSRGSLELDRPDVRHRLVADADYLRGLISTGSSTAGMRLVGDLAALNREHAASGLRLHQQLSDLPDELPDEVLAAVSAAVREALNNVLRHSGATEAWVTVTGEQAGQPGAIRVAVTDRGRGFDLAGVRGGIGLRQSIAARLDEVGGGSAVDSEPGQGTSVELWWPR